MELIWRRKFFSLCSLAFFLYVDRQALKTSEKETRKENKKKKIDWYREFFFLLVVVVVFFIHKFSFYVLTLPFSTELTHSSLFFLRFFLPSSCFSCFPPRFFWALLSWKIHICDAKRERWPSVVREKSILHFSFNSFFFFLAWPHAHMQCGVSFRIGGEMGAMISILESADLTRFSLVVLYLLITFCLIPLGSYNIVFRATLKTGWACD